MKIFSRRFFCSTNFFYQCDFLKKVLLNKSVPKLYLDHLPVIASLNDMLSSDRVFKKIIIKSQDKFLEDLVFLLGYGVFPQNNTLNNFLLYYNIVQKNSISNINRILALMYLYSYNACNSIQLNDEFKEEIIKQSNVNMIDSTYEKMKYKTLLLKVFNCTLSKQSHDEYCRELIKYNISTTISKTHKEIIKLISLKGKKFSVEKTVLFYQTDIFIDPNLVIEINGENHFLLNTTLKTGKTYLKEFLLKNNGFNVVNVNYFEDQNYIIKLNKWMT